MKVRDVMTSPVLSVEPNTPILQAVQIILQRHISGLPVVDKDGRLTGIVTEGDFLRRTETGTQRRRPRWLEYLVGPGRLADEYARSHGRKVGDVMTTDPTTITEDAPLDEVVRIMERRQIKTSAGDPWRQAGRHRQPRQPRACPGGDGARGRAGASQR